jgi:hypothetical protein
VGELPREVVEQAKTAGGGWYYEVVGEHGEPVPNEAIRGAWRVGPDGVLTGEYVPNPGFGGQRPAARGCPFHRPATPAS